MVALIAGAFLFVYGGSVFKDAPAQTTTQHINLYANGTYGISFPYSDAYLVSEGERGTPQHPHYAIVLTHKDDVTLPVGGEGPTTITIDIYDVDSLTTLEQWLATTPESNLGLGSGKTIPLVVGEQDALTYRWSGLYEGITTVLLHNERIVTLTVTYLSPEDQIIKDYQVLVDGFTLTK